jgi:Zn-dependent protease
LGHLIFLKFYKIKVSKLTIYSFGFLLTKEEYKTFSDEFIIYSAGIIFNLITAILTKGIISEISFLLMIVNLLPIYPFDGYNILELIISYFIPFKYSIIISSIINIITIILVSILFFKYIDLLIIINILYMLYLPINRIININKIYNVFILNRMLNSKFMKTKYIKFDEKIHDKIYRFHTVKCKISNKEIFEKEIIYLKYKYY